MKLASSVVFALALAGLSSASWACPKYDITYSPVEKDNSTTLIDKEKPLIADVKKTEKTENAN